MKIACCTPEIITLIFPLFVGFNGGFQYLDALRGNVAPTSTPEVVSTWGEPDRVATAAEVGFSSANPSDVQTWSNNTPKRTTILRDNEIISIREG